MSNLVLSSPLKGWVSSLGEAADVVFAERMLGDGLAIDPLGSSLHAPCDGTVISAHRAGHAVTLRAANGAEILMHVGLETVALGGEGFSVRVREGQAVKAGQTLVDFDLDLLARRAKSLITPVVITNGEAFEIVRRDQDQTVEVGGFLMALRPLAGAVGVASDEASEISRAVISRAVVVPLAHGIHARPAARIAELAKAFAAQATLAAGERRASARSPVGLMALAVRHGDTIQIIASGADAQDAIAAIAELIESGMGEGAPVPAKTAPPAAVATPEPLAPAKPPADGVLKGVLAAPGLSIGKAARLAARDIAVREQGEGVAHEEAALAAALDRVRARIERNASRDGGDTARKAILAAHLAFLDDPELLAQARALIAQGKSAGLGWRGAVGGYVEALRGLGDRRLAERVDDLIDLERQVLAALLVLEGGGEDDDATALAPGSILLADELLPSQLMGLDPGVVAGLATARGGPTSHVAILAAAMGIPALVALGAGVLGVEDGAALILDADGGTLRIAPDAPALEAAQTELARRQARKAAARDAAHAPAVTLDGTRIEVFANTGSVKDALAAVEHGAEGCGLLRTEFLFLDRQTPPDEDEQARQYQAVADALQGRPLIIRTLDVGGDKAAPYLPIPAEENPALGLRGVRVSLWRPHLLKTQLRAILRVAGPCKIMVPMIASLDELRAVRAVLDEAQREVAAELGAAQAVELGVMIETPAAAMTADLIAAEADFLSIGTNDLTQYVLAMDRGNPELAARIDALHPAVLRMIQQTCQGARKHDRWVGVCGGLASDLVATPILLGLGVTELSATAAVVPEVKAAVRALDLAACRDLAARALEQTSPEAVRALCKSFGA